MTNNEFWYGQNDGLVQDRSNFSALAMELLQSCTNHRYVYGVYRYKYISKQSFLQCKVATVLT